MQCCCEGGSAAGWGEEVGGAVWARAERSPPRQTLMRAYASTRAHLPRRHDKSAVLTAMQQQRASDRRCEHEAARQAVDAQRADRLAQQHEAVCQPQQAHIAQPTATSSCARNSHR